MKRFYQDVSIRQAEAGFQILLDSRPVRTARHNPLAVPERAIAELIAGEWRHQEHAIHYHTMHAMRMAASVIDLFPNRRHHVVREISDYISSDLLIFRAAHPKALIARQSKLWDPPMGWVKKAFAVDYVTTDAIAPLEQPAHTQQTLSTHVSGLDDWSLIGLHAATRTTGSLILALTLRSAAIAVTETVDAACIDEHFARETWGEEADLDKRLAAAKADIEAAGRWFEALKERELDQAASA